VHARTPLSFFYLTKTLAQFSAQINGYFAEHVPVFADISGESGMTCGERRSHRAERRVHPARMPGKAIMVSGFFGV